MRTQKGLIWLLLIIPLSCSSPPENQGLPVIKVSENKRFLVTGDEEPFFWLGDTGWLLFSKLNREEADIYLSNRADLGFNVIQVMVLHSLGATNIYGDSALIGRNVANPLETPGNASDDTLQYDYWDHIDFIVDKAAGLGIYLALVPVWGSNVRGGKVSENDAAVYAEWIANRYKNRSNIIWLNGGDVRGSDYINIWNTIGSALRATDPNHLITFHPFGRTASSQWFHNEEWLDFNMFQSGHRRYDQDDTEGAFGEDNWRFVESDLSLFPVKPTIDGEPSYEGIPQGLHDTTQAYWQAEDARRYAYWSVFAGSFGHTYGHSSVMQFYRSSDKAPAYGAKKYWEEAIDDPGAGQMRYLKKLMLSHPFPDRIPDQSLIPGNNGLKYEYLIATRGDDYAMIYTYTGRVIPVQMGKIRGDFVRVSWFNPSNGELTEIGEFENSGIKEFDPPGEPASGNDWVLLLSSV